MKTHRAFLRKRLGLAVLLGSAWVVPGVTRADEPGEGPAPGSRASPGATSAGSPSPRDDPATREHGSEAARHRGLRRRVPRVRVERGERHALRHRRPRAAHKVADLKVGRTPNQVALSPSGAHLGVLDNADSTITVIDTSTLSVLRTLPAGRAPHILAMSPRRNLAVVTSEGDGTLDLFDLGSFERVGRVPVFGFPRVLAVTADGATAFLTVRWLNGVLAVDLQGKGPRGRLALGEVGFAPEGKDAHGVALTPDGQVLLVTSQMTGQLTFADAATFAVVGQLEVGRNPNWVEVTPDGRFAVVSNTDDDTATVVDVAARSVRSTTRVGRQPKRLVVGACP